MDKWTWISIILLAVSAALLAAAFVLTMRARKQSKIRRKRTGAALEPGIRIGKLHETGKREEQQDSFGVSDTSLAESHGVLAAVADGMGGLEDGGKVSAAIVESVLDNFMMYGGKLDPKTLLLTLAKEAVTGVNEMLGPGALRKSGSTAVLSYMYGGYLTFFSIGDSRICLFRGGSLLQLNREQTYEHELCLKALNGELSISDALHDKKGGALVNFAGMGALRGFDMPASPIKMLPGDKVILMSDGVYNALSEEELCRSITGSCEEAVNAIRELIEEKQYSSQDNYTAVIILYGGEE